MCSLVSGLRHKNAAKSLNAIPGGPAINTHACITLFSKPNGALAGSDGRGYLVRTYYAEVEYVLPEAVMQPVWDSVKKKDGVVDFGLSYHRAFYSQDYDDYHDIYLQRRERPSCRP